MDLNWLKLKVSVDKICCSIETQCDAGYGTTLNIPDDRWSENETEIPAGTIDTMLTTSHFVSNRVKKENNIV